MSYFRDTGQSCGGGRGAEVDLLTSHQRNAGLVLTLPANVSIQFKFKKPNLTTTVVSMGF